MAIDAKKMPREFTPLQNYQITFDGGSDREPFLAFSHFINLINRLIVDTFCRVLYSLLVPQPASLSSFHFILVELFCVNHSDNLGS